MSAGVIASQAFSPNKISGLKLNLDASDRATLTVDEVFEIFVSEWASKTSNGNKAIQFTGANQPLRGTWPLNDNDAIRFTTDFMILESQPIVGTQARTIIVVGFAEDGINSNTFVSLSDVGGSGGQYRITAEIAIRVDGGSGVFAADAVESGQAAIITATNEANSTIALNASNFQIYKNGTLLIGSTSGTAVNTNIGAAGIGDDADGPSFLRLKGVIAQLIIYDKVISDFERQQVENYLSNKWGISFPFVFSSAFSSAFS